MIPEAFIFAEKSATRSHTFWHCVMHVPLQRTRVNESSNVNLLWREEKFHEGAGSWCRAKYFISAWMEMGRSKMPKLFMQMQNLSMCTLLLVKYMFTYINLQAEPFELWYNIIVLSICKEDKKFKRVLNQR
jgi:hypothetical protein